MGSGKGTKKTTKPSEPSSSDTKTATASTSKKRKSDAGEAAPPSKKAKPDPLDISSVTDDDLEYNDPQPVYETCNEIRRKIRAMLRKDGVTQAAFLRAISAENPSGKAIAVSSLHAFLNKKKPLPLDGNTSCVYYAAYVFFEKLRLRDRKPKSNHREAMEELWCGERGVPLKGRQDRFIVSAERTPYIDEYGRVSVF